MLFMHVHDCVFNTRIYMKKTSVLRFLNIVARQITDARTSAQKAKCEAQISDKDLRRSIQNMGKRKSPGPDEIPAEFYDTTDFSLT